MGDYEVIKKGTVEVGYTIVAYPADDGSKIYDVITSNGIESDEWFPNVPEAESWVNSMFGG